METKQLYVVDSAGPAGFGASKVGSHDYSLSQAGIAAVALSRLHIGRRQGPYRYSTPATFSFSLNDTEIHTDHFDFLLLANMVRKTSEDIGTLSYSGMSLAAIITGARLVGRRAMPLMVIFPPNQLATSQVTPLNVVTLQKMLQDYDQTLSTHGAHWVVQQECRSGPASVVSSSKDSDLKWRKEWLENN